MVESSLRDEPQGEPDEKGLSREVDGDANPGTYQVRSTTGPNIKEHHDGSNDDDEVSQALDQYAKNHEAQSAILRSPLIQNEIQDQSLDQAEAGNNCFKAIRSTEQEKEEEKALLRIKIEKKRKEVEALQKEAIELK